MQTISIFNIDYMLIYILGSIKYTIKINLTHFLYNHQKSKITYVAQIYLSDSPGLMDKARNNNNVISISGINRKLWEYREGSS